MSSVNTGESSVVNSIGFIGLGNMAGAIIQGLRASEDYRHAHILGFDRNPPKCEAAKANFLVEICDSAAQLAAACDVLVFAIKPQGLDELMENIASFIKPGQLVISLAASRTLASYTNKLGEHVCLVQAMPNINAKIARSATALCANQQVSGPQLETARQIFQAVGSVVVLPESKLPAFSAIAGAGPAFAYLFIDALASAGIQAGLTRS